MNLPVGVAALALAPRVDRRSRDGARRDRLDVRGAVLVAGALVAIVLPLVEGRQRGLAAVDVAVAGRRRAAAGRRSPPASAAWPRAAARRSCRRALFHERAFTVGLLGSIVFYAGMASFFLVLAVYLQEGRGLDALGSGLVFTPLAVGYLAASIAAQKLGRHALALGGVIRAASLAGLALTVGAIGLGGDDGRARPGAAGRRHRHGPADRAAGRHGAGRDGGEGRGRRHRRAVHGEPGRQHDRRGRDRRAVLRRARAGGDFAGAFELAVAAIAGVCLAVAALVQLLPGSERAPAGLTPEAA